MLEYLALAALLLSITAVFYIFVFIHDLPHRIAKKRRHPQAEAIHYACWLSLFTLHALWPLVFLWAVSNRDPIEVRVREGTLGGADLDELRREIASLRARLDAADRAVQAANGGRA